LIFFRSEQGRLNLIPLEVIESRIAELEERSDLFGIGRLYRRLGDFQEAVKATCQGTILALEQGNIFSAAFYLKEMVTEGDLESLFMISLEKARSQNDLWWQYRALQELEWYSETYEFLIEHSSEIEGANNPLLVQELAAALGDWQRYIEMRKGDAKSESARSTPAEKSRDPLC
jgi:hypothetical protein